MRFLSSLVLLCALLCVHPLQAKTFAIPSDNPLAIVTIPNSWEPNEYDIGVEGTSKDGQFYFAFEALERKDSKHAFVEAMTWFKKQGVDLDVNSQTSNEVEIAGMPSFLVSFKGKDKDGPTNVTVVIVSTHKKDRFLLIYGWGSDSADQANRKEIDKILSSLVLKK